MENITENEYFKAKHIWNQMKLLSTQKEMTDEERTLLRENFKIVESYEAKKR